MKHGEQPQPGQVAGGDVIGAVPTKVLTGCYRIHHQLFNTGIDHPPNPAPKSQQSSH